jgi:hypothetical protein
MAKLYVNENFPAAIVGRLRELGHDILTSREAGQANLGIPDDRVLRFAIERGRIVLTHNRNDFIRLHRRVRDHSGIIVCRYDAEAERQASLIHAALTEHDSLAGRLVRVGKRTMRLDRD